MLSIEVINSVRCVVATINVHFIAILAYIMERLRGNLRVSIHAEEKAQVEHSLYLFHFEKIAHVLDKLTLKFISTLFVPIHSVALLWQYRHVVTALI